MHHRRQGIDGCVGAVLRNRGVSHRDRIRGSLHTITPKLAHAYVYVSHTYHPSFQEAGEHAGLLGTYQLVRPTPLGGVVAYAPMLQGALGRALGSRECIYSGLVGSVDEGIGEKVEVVTDGFAKGIDRGQMK